MFWEALRGLGAGERERERERERGRESTCACWGLLRLQRQALQLLSGSDTGCYSALRFQVCVLCLATMLVARSAQHAVHGADEPAMELFLEEARASGSQRSEMEEAKMAIRDVDPPTDLLAVAADGSGGTDAAAERSGTATPVPPPGSGGTDAAAEPRGTATPVPPLLNDAPDDGAAVKASEPAAPAEGLRTARTAVLWARVGSHRPLSNPAAARLRRLRLRSQLLQFQRPTVQPLANTLRMRRRLLRWWTRRRR